jgi:integrase
MADAMTRAKLPHLHSYRDRHGRMRHYVRRPGAKEKPIPGEYLSPEFMAAYRAVMADDVDKPQIGSGRTKPGTVDAVIVGYYTSLAFRSLAPSSQHKRRLILERFREKNGGNSIATLKQDFIKRVLDHKAPFAARNWLKAMRALLEFAVDQGFRTDNPAIGLKLPRVKSDGIHCWLDDELEQFERYYAAGVLERRAFALFFHTGQRIGDVVRMGRQHIRGDAIAVRQGKTGTPLLIPIADELREHLDLSNMTFLVSPSGKPFTAAGLSDWFKKRCVRAGLPHCCAHGLRKAFCRRKAELGWTAHEIMSISGHKTLKEVERYTKAVDQVRLARQAMKRERIIG